MSAETSASYQQLNRILSLGTREFSALRSQWNTAEAASRVLRAWRCDTCTPVFQRTPGIQIRLSKFCVALAFRIVLLVRASQMFKTQCSVTESSHRFLRIAQSLRSSSRYYSSESYYTSESYYSEEEEEEEEEIVTAS